MEGFKDPYAGMKFNPEGFDKAIDKIRSGFDANIQEAGMQAGMAAGNTGLNPGRVAADVYSKAASSRDASVGQVELQKAGAENEFNQQKQFASAQAKAEYEKNKPGFFDWLQGGLQIAGGIATLNPGNILGGVKNTFGNFNKLNYNPKASAIQRASGPIITDNPVGTDNAGFSLLNNNALGFGKQFNWGNIKRKPNTFNFEQPKLTF